MIAQLMQLLEPRLLFAAQATFQGLGDLPGGDLYSWALGISADGTTVVGESDSASGTEAFRWTRDGGMVGLGDLAGGDFGSQATAVSADGSVIVGYGTEGSVGHYRAFRWTQASGLATIGSLDGGSFSRAWAVSNDGSVVVGDGSSASGAEAFRWTQAGGMVGLGHLAGGNFTTIASAVSADGTVVAGIGSSTADKVEAFRWASAGGMQSLGDLPSGRPIHAYAMSADGSIIVGEGSSAGQTEAFCWTAEGGTTWLGDLPGGPSVSVAHGISADGSIIVGSASIASATDTAFIWDSAHGMRSLKAVLVSAGADLTGWTLTDACVSADGTTFAGAGTHNGYSEAWIATLTRPIGTDDSYNTDEDTPLVVDAASGVLANDINTDGDSLTAVLVAGPAHGALTLNADGSFAYTAAPNYHGSDSFTYKADDSAGQSDATTVTITVNSVNDAPVANDDSYLLGAATSLSVNAASGVTANDVDVDDDPLTVSLVSDVTHGTLSLNADGSFTYTRADGYFGTDSFTYRVSDDMADSNIATATILDFALVLPKKMYEGRAVIISSIQPQPRGLWVRDWSIDWGDGTPVTVVHDRNPFLHTYSQFGDYSVTVTGTRRDGQPIAPIHLTLNVRNVAPKPVIGGFGQVVPDQPLTYELNPGDSAPLETLCVTWTLEGQKIGSGVGSAADLQSVPASFAKPGRYRFRLSFTDAGGLVGTTRRTIIVKPVVEQPDPADPSKTNLVIGGTDKDDLITVRDRRSGVEVFVNGASFGFFNPSGKIIAFGGKGDDVIAADSTVPNPLEFYGGDGNDILAGGAGPNKLVGGKGKNKIFNE
jgi:probable HAF family extracellular repeat protein/VCBS repeat-containing protein